MLRERQNEERQRKLEELKQHVRRGNFFRFLLINRKLRRPSVERHCVTVSHASHSFFRD